MAARRKNGPRVVTDWTDWFGRGGVSLERPGLPRPVKRLFTHVENFFEERYHPRVDGTIAIHDQTITVTQGHTGTPDLKLTADTRTWLEVLAGDRSFLIALLRRKIRVRGPKRLLTAFVRCFPQ